MVETPTSKATKMVKTLNAVHRWAVTGTPIEKSIHQLYGLLYFLDCVPYNEYSVWAKVAQSFVLEGNPDPLIQGVLKNVMWRTCKRNVLDQLGIPPQTQRCHLLTMSDLQMVFYKDQHEQCRAAFLQQAAKMRHHGLATNMAKWDAHSFNVLMEPLRKLRQDCTMPTVVSRGDQVQKRLLSPDELYSHLLSVNELDCKAKLRSIVSNLNGLAGIACIMQDFELAAKYYKSVLRRSEENKTGAITVDSLLRIHALHCLIQLINQARVQEEADNLQDYKSQLRALEVKYTGNCYQQVGVNFFCG